MSSPFRWARAASLAPAACVSGGAGREESNIDADPQRDDRPDGGRASSLTFLLALRRSALRLAFSSSLRSSSPLIAPWNTDAASHLAPPHACRSPTRLPFGYLGWSGCIAGVRGRGTTVHLLLRLMDRSACLRDRIQPTALEDKNNNKIFIAALH